MGIVAVASSMPPPGIDLGALFGLGGFTPERKVDDWNWQAPGVKEKSKPARWSMAVGGRKKEKWEAFLDVPEEASPEDLVYKSKQAFEEMLQRNEKALQVRSEDFKEIFDFLKAAENEPGACNTLRLAEWLVSQDLLEANFSAYHELLLGKIRLQTLGDRELTSALSLLLNSTNAAEHVVEMASLLDALPSDGALAQTCAVLTRTSLEHENSKQALPYELGVWLSVLRTAQCLQGDHFFSPAWRRTYDILARRFPTITPLREHLSILKRLDMSRILLRHWVPLISNGEQGDSGNLVATSAGYAKWLTQPKEHRLRIDSLLADFEALSSKYMTRRERCSGFASAAQMIAVLHHHRIPYVELCHGLFDVLMHSSSVGSVYRVFYGITHHARISIDNALAQKLIEYFIAKKRLDLAEKVFIATPALPLSACYELPLMIARHRACSSSRLWSMLQRLTPEDAVPPERRSHPQNRMPQEHVDLIHLVAFYVSRSPHMDPRSAYRRIWECYLFLRDRKATIKPMLSRAFVTAGLIRPFTSLQKVSMTKFRYTLMLVERYEGREVAEQLDRLAWKMWNEKVLPGIRARNTFTDVARDLSSLQAAQQDPDSVKTRLFAATKRFREARMWLLPDKMRKWAEHSNYKPFPGLDTADAAADLEAVKGQIAGYSPFVLAEDLASGQHAAGELRESTLSTTQWPIQTVNSDTNELANEMDKFSTSQTLDILQDHPPGGSSPDMAVRSVDVPRSGLGYTSAHSSINVHGIDRPATLEAPSPSQRSTAAWYSATTCMPHTVATSHERESPVGDSILSGSGASQTQPVETLERARTSTRPDLVSIGEEEPQQAVGTSNEPKHGATLSLWPRKEGVQRKLSPSQAAALSDPSIEWKPLKSGHHQIGKTLVLDRPPSTWRGVSLHGVTDKGDRDAEILVADFMNTISSHEDVKPAPKTTRTGSASIVFPSDDASRAVAATSLDAILEPDPIRTRLSWRRVSLNLGSRMGETMGTNDLEAKFVIPISTSKPASSQQGRPALDHLDVTQHRAEGKPGSSHSSPSPHSQGVRSPRTLEGHVLMKTVEIQCWRNTTRASPDSLSLKTHDYLLWRKDATGRHRLYIDWNDEWIKLSKARLEAIQYEREGKMDQAKALKRMIRAASEGRAKFEDDSRGGRPGRNRRGPKEVVRSIRMVKSDGKG